MVIKIKLKKAKSGTYISAEKIISVMPGTSEFWSIIFSKPLPIDTAKKICGIIPISVISKAVDVSAVIISLIFKGATNKFTKFLLQISSRNNILKLILALNKKS